jgi:hypothetical protein
MTCKFCTRQSLRHHPRKRMIQYSTAFVDYLDRRGVLDARLRGHDSE